MPRALPSILPAAPAGASRKSLRAGDVIEEVDQPVVEKPSDLSEVIDALKRGRGWHMLPDFERSVQATSSAKPRFLRRSALRLLGVPRTRLRYKRPSFSQIPN
jgi:hypothetical protein